jgi:hypothetical protein
MVHFEQWVAVHETLQMVWTMLFQITYTNFSTHKFHLNSQPTSNHIPHKMVWAVSKLLTQIIVDQQRGCGDL